MTKILEETQSKAEKVATYYNINKILELSKEFIKLSIKLEDLAIKLASSGDKVKIEMLNHTLIWVGRHINPIAHSDAEISEQVSMETFGAQPFPRISRIMNLASMTLHQSSEFKLLITKLVRESNYVEDGFYNANELIKDTIKRLE